jgi:hypothetical protein
MDSEPRPLPGGGDDLERSLILADLRHRRVLAILLERSLPTTVEELAARIASLERGVEPEAATEEDCRSIRTDLRHRCLPKLEDLGWIERRRGGVVVDEPLAVETGRLSLPDLRNPEHPLWGAISVLLARPYRCELASVLADRDGFVGVAELATELLERGRSSRAIPSEESLPVTLHHVDLPKMAAVDLVEYDSGARTVAGTPRLQTVVDLTGLDAE